MPPNSAADSTWLYNMASTTAKGFMQPVVDYFGVLTGFSDEIVLGLIVAFIIGVVTLFIIVIVGSKKSSRNAILLAGLCDAGKTAIFTQLVHKKKCESFTSIEVNSGTYRFTQMKKSVRVIDMPGHERLRNRYLDEFKGSIKGIIFVVDSLAFQSQLQDVAEFLYNLLTDKIITSNCRSLLIACNKQDNSLAKSSKLIKNQLEREINTLRVTRSGQLSSVDNTKSEQVILGKKDKDFEFGHLYPQQVEFVECSAALDKDSQLTLLESWITKVA
ncbi:hypothetical protein CHUAL_009071 [Chamberlinius hualienensis]